MTGFFRRVGVAAGCLAMIGGVAACSDDGESLTEEAFLEQANAICTAGEDVIDDAAEELFTEEEPAPEQLSEFADLFEENIGGQIDEIDDLEGPSDLEDELDPVLDDARETVEEFATLLREDPESAFTAGDPFADVNERLSELGLSACSDSE